MYIYIWENLGEGGHRKGREKVFKEQHGEESRKQGGVMNEKYGGTMYQMHKLWILMHDIGLCQWIERDICAQ